MVNHAQSPAEDFVLSLQYTNSVLYAACADVDFGCAERERARFSVTCTIPCVLYCTVLYCIVLYVTAVRHTMRHPRFGCLG